MRAGIFGGSFDPIHMGHMIIAEYIRDYAKLDKVFFIPVGEPSHRENNLASASHRKRMVELAVEGNEYFEVSDIELGKSVKNYTIDTLREMMAQYPEYDFCEIIGEDSAAYIEQWKEYEELLNIAEFYVFKREGYTYTKDYKNIFLVNTPKIEISATMIRERVRSGATIKYLVPEKVEEYIIRENLYKK